MMVGVMCDSVCKQNCCIVWKGSVCVCVCVWEKGTDHEVLSAVL